MKFEGCVTRTAVRMSGMGNCNVTVSVGVDRMGLTITSISRMLTEQILHVARPLILDNVRNGGVDLMSCMCGVSHHMRWLYELDVNR